LLSGLRETFQLLDDPECDKLGRQSWVMIAIIVTELLICIKFGWSTITKPLPRHIALWWVLGAAILLVYTVVKFYLLKPNHIPKPEKENIRMGSPVNTPAKHKDFPVENNQNLELSGLYQDQNREDKKDL
jgi:hypothetical protein